MQLRPPTVVRRKVSDTRRARWTQEEIDERFYCSPVFGKEGFRRWCTRHVKIEDKETKRAIAFVWFEGQDALADDLVAGYWLLVLKGRQLGITWLAAAYTLWRITYARDFTAVVLCQEVQYAEDFIRRIKWIHSRLPSWSQETITTDNARNLRLDAGGCQRCIRSLAPSDKAARSITGDLVIGDEASRIDRLAETLVAATPAVEVAHGQILVMTTSAGPAGDFHDLWYETYGEGGLLLDKNGRGPTGYKAHFLHWSMRPGRDAAWYLRQKTRLDKLSSVAIKQEYPSTPEEAFEYAAGRIYPQFTRANIGAAVVTSDWIRYRGIDWGEADSAYVVLWAAVLPDGPPGLIVSPKCPNTIREMLQYRKEDDPPFYPRKEDDHAPDVIRYIVTRFKIKGTLYIYREVYRKDSLVEGWTPTKEIEEIHELSGWIPGDPLCGDRELWKPSAQGELYVNTVFDRSWGKMGSLFRAQGIPCVPSQRLKGTGKVPADKPTTERLEGIKMVRTLIEGTERLPKRIHVHRQEKTVSRITTTPTDRGKDVLRHGRLRDLARKALRGGRGRL